MLMVFEIRIFGMKKEDIIQMSLSKNLVFLNLKWKYQHKLLLFFILKKTHNYFLALKAEKI